jgi:hypothetical protein
MRELPEPSAPGHPGKFIKVTKRALEADNHAIKTAAEIALAEALIAPAHHFRNAFGGPMISRSTTACRSVARW